MKRNKALLNKKETTEALRIYKMMLDSKVENISIYGIHSSKGKHDSNTFINGTILVGLLIVRSDKSFQEWIKESFAQDFCFNALGSPVYFRDKEGDKAYIDWRIELFDANKIDGDLIDFILFTSDLFGVIEPLDTETPYFGKLNHFIRNAKLRTKIYR